MDNMIAMMEKYTDHLEEIVSERTKELHEEKKKTDELLFRMLPRLMLININLVSLKLDLLLLGPI